MLSLFVSHNKRVAEGISLPIRKKSVKRALTEKEGNIILTANYNDYQKAYAYLLYYTGMRRCEILALSKNDISISKKIIHVKNNVVFKGGISVLNNYTKTAAGNREIPIIPELKIVLEKYLNIINGIYLFEYENTFPIKLSQFKNIWSELFNAINLNAGGSENVLAINKDITPHMFRHNFATMLYYAGIDIKSVQRIMGHSSVRVLLDIYTHLDNKNNDLVYDKLSAFMDGRQSTDSQNSL